MLSQTIRDHRIKLGISQVKLSHLSGVSLPTIQNIEMGKANPSLETLDALCRALFLSISIGEKEADLDLLIAAGLPLSDANEITASTPKPEELKTELSILCMQLSKKDADQRVKEATQAMLASIQSHFPTWYQDNLSRIPVITNLIPTKPNGRIIKLSRQAHTKLSRVL